MLPWWPNMVGGLLWPFLTVAMKRWIPEPFSAALSFLIAWLAVGVVYLRRPPTPAWTFPRWAGGALAGAATVGVLSYLLPW